MKVADSEKPSGEKIEERSEIVDNISEQFLFGERLQFSFGHGFHSQAMRPR